MKSVYVEKLLRLKPNHTKGGTPIEIVNNGNYVCTRTGRSRNGQASYYAPCDYPQLFGWPRVGRVKAKAPLVIEHNGYKYIRTIKK